MTQQNGPLRCLCDEIDRYGFNACEVHVHCDDNCRALADPRTLDEVKAALDHWEKHRYLRGCSHGR